MINELAYTNWMKQNKPSDCDQLIRQHFGDGYTFRRWTRAADSSRAPAFLDEAFKLEWVLVPSGKFRRGISAEEEAEARRLSADPLLNFEEMRPAQDASIDAFLMLASPLSVANAPVNPIDVIGPADTLLCDEPDAVALASKLGARLPSEVQWEYACRAGSNDLFWFGTTLPPVDRLERILGLASPAEANHFGLSSLFYGEWCSDFWRKDLSADTSAELQAGRVIRGGAARFWPWQDSREWSGCVSAFRMPGKDSGGAGAAVRLVRERRR